MQAKKMSSLLVLIWVPHIQWSLFIEMVKLILLLTIKYQYYPTFLPPAPAAMPTLLNMCVLG
jgi:hypothetical protein